MVVQLDRKRFTVADFQQMVETGIIQKDDRCELLNGEIVNLKSISPKHAAIVNRINRLFQKHLSASSLIGVQNSLELGTFSQLQPDIALLRWQDNYYEADYPQPSDIYLLIEVADSTLELDRSIKLPLYAQTGIAEVWIVNLLDNQIQVYRQPIEDAYSVAEGFTVGQMLTITTLPDMSIAVENILG